MRYLNNGRSVRVVTDDVAGSWPRVAARAERNAAEYGGGAIVYIRTDTQAVGIIALRADAPVTFSDDGQTTDPEFGVIITASADLDQLNAAIAAERGPEPEPTDADVEELVRKMKADRPDLDWDNLLTGRLAGPATSNRPDVPVWDYLSFAGGRTEVSLSDLTAARFPVRYLEGASSVTSVDEELRPFPFSYKGTPPKPRFTETPRTVISRYAALHDADVIAWDPAERGIVYLKPVGSYRAVLQAWVDSLVSPS